MSRSQFGVGFHRGYREGCAVGREEGRREAQEEAARCRPPVPTLGKTVVDNAAYSVGAYFGNKLGNFLVERFRERWGRR